MELKRISRPGLAKFIPVDTSSEIIVTPFIDAAKYGRSEFEFKAARAWDIELPSGSWRLATIQFEAAGAGEEDSKYVACARTFVQKARSSEKPITLISTCAPTPNPATGGDPSGYEPYDLFDVDGDGAAEIVLKEVVGYSQKLSAFKVENSEWKNILTDCMGGD